MKTIILLAIILFANLANVNSTTNNTEGKIRLPQSGSSCKVEVIDANVFGRIKELVSLQIKLLIYDFSFPEAAADPFRTSKHYFKPNKFYRAFQKHGQTLLALAFNYGILSVFTLELGVITERIELRDKPTGCFSDAEEDEKINILIRAIFAGFDNGPSPPVTIEAFERICHEIITVNGIYADFEDRCCHWDAQIRDITCSKDIYNFWVELLNVLLLLLKILVFVFGPLMIPRWLYTSQPHRVRYLVKLKEPLVKFITVANPGNVDRYYSRAKKVIDLTSERGFPTCKVELKNFTPGEKIRVKISSYRLLINYGKLLLENKVPVGLFKVLKRAICLCKLKEISPFNDCCEAAILPFRKVKDVKWIHLCKLFTRIMLILLLPLPYYVRVILYYLYESNEIDSRFKATDRLGKTMRFNFRFMHYLGPTHGLFIGIYIVYIFTACFLAYSHQRGKDSHFQRVMIKSFRELRNSVWLSSLKFLTFNILYPMRKFGLLGIVVGLIYWPLAIPFSLLVCVIYCLPLFYLIFRMLRYARDATTLKEDDDDEILFMADKQRINKKLEEEMEKLKTGSLLREFKQRRKSKADSKINLHKISTENIGEKKKNKEKDEEKPKEKEKDKESDKGRDVEKEIEREINKDQLIQQDSIGTFSSFESDEGDQMLKHQQSELDHGERMERNRKREKFKLLVQGLWQNLVGLMCIVAMASVMMLMAECVGYMVEMFVFTLMGIIVNAGAVLRYVTLSLLVILYSYDCYNNVAKQYLKLNQAMFAEVKDRIHGISEVTSLPSYLQENMGFKAQEASDQADHENPDDICGGDDGETLLPQSLFWDLNDLILFIDSDDVPRVPRKLFEELCEIRVSGSPGPVYLSLLAATKRFLIIVIFLLFVLIVVMSFGEIYQVSSTNQMLATFAGGFLPLMLRKVLQPIAPEPELKSLTFKSKMDEIIKNYHQLWPMFDLPLELYPEEEDDKEEDEGNEGGTDQPDGLLSRLQQKRNDFKKAVSFSLDKQSDKCKIEIEEEPEKDIDILFIIPAELDSNRNSWGMRSRPDFRRKAIRKEVPSSPTNRKSMNALQRMTSIGHFIKDNLDV